MTHIHAGKKVQEMINTYIILKSRADTRIIDHLDCSLHPVYNDNNAVF